MKYNPLIPLSYKLSCATKSWPLSCVMALDVCKLTLTTFCKNWAHPLRQRLACKPLTFWEGEWVSSILLHSPLLNGLQVILSCMHVLRGIFHCPVPAVFKLLRLFRFTHLFDRFSLLPHHCDNTLGACHLIFSTAFSKQSNLFCTFPSRSKASQDPISAYTFLEISSNQPGHSMVDSFIIKAPSQPCYDITSTIDINVTKPRSAFSVDNHTARCGYRPWRIRTGSMERPGEENLLGVHD